MIDLDFGHDLDFDSILKWNDFMMLYISCIWNMLLVFKTVEFIEDDETQGGRYVTSQILAQF